jgi:hypothetical protein
MQQITEPPPFDFRAAEPQPVPQQPAAAQPTVSKEVAPPILQQVSPSNPAVLEVLWLGSNPYASHLSNTSRTWPALIYANLGAMKKIQS